MYISTTLDVTGFNPIRRFERSPDAVQSGRSRELKPTSAQSGRAQYQ